MIADALFILIGGVVLLIDDDQAGVVQRRKNQRARSDHDARLTRQGRGPAGPSLADVLRAMRDAHQRAEARAKRPHHLIGEGDFRHHHDDVATRGERTGGELEINLGLATPSHAMEEETLVTLLLDGARDGFDRGALVVL